MIYIWSKKREKNDEFLSKLAFGGYAAHYTKPYVADNHKLFEELDNQNIIPEQQDIAYISDISFLSKYKVRQRYDKYGAIAYFDFEYKILAIYVSHLNKFEKVPDEDTTVTWEHAKWVWRVSVSVATFLEIILVLHVLKKVMHLLLQLWNHLIVIILFDVY